jgi:hypothetical protein
MACQLQAKDRGMFWKSEPIYSADGKFGLVGQWQQIVGVQKRNKMDLNGSAQSTLAPIWGDYQPTLVPIGQMLMGLAANPANNAAIEAPPQQLKSGCTGPALWAGLQATANDFFRRRARTPLGMWVMR